MIPIYMKAVVNEYDYVELFRMQGMNMLLLKNFPLVQEMN